MDEYYLTPGGLHLGWEEPDPRVLWAWEQEEWRGDYKLGSPRYAGDWIPYGRVPLELIPELDTLRRIGVQTRDS